MAFSQGGCSVVFDMRPPSHFIWFPLCGQFQSLALAGGWRSPGPRRLKPNPRREEGLGQEKRWLSGCRGTAVLCALSHSGRTWTPYMRTVEKQPSPQLLV